MNNQNNNKINFGEMQKMARKFSSAVSFDKVLSSGTRLLISNLFLFLSFLFLGLIIFKVSQNNILKTENFSFWEEFKGYIQNDGLYFAIFSIFFSLFLILKAFRAYLFSIIFNKNKEITFDLTKIINNKKGLLSAYAKKDSTEAFLGSVFGKEISRRLFIKEKNIKEFLKNKKKFIFEDDFVFEKNDFIRKRIGKSIGATDYAQALIENDEEFQIFLLKNQITKKDFIKTTLWATRKYYNYKESKRWWSRKNLAKFGQIGTALSYGQNFTLDKFATSLASHKSIFGKTSFENYAEDVKELERVLVKANRNNAFLVSDSTGLSLELLKAFDKKVKAGQSQKSLERSKIYILSSLMLLETAGSKFEEIFLKLLKEARESGNIILVFNDFYPFYERAKSFGIDVLSIMENYFQTDLSFIILSDKNTYESFLQTNSYLAEYFETITTAQNSTDGLLFLLQDKIFEIENKNNILFSFGSLEYLIKSAKNFYANQATSEKFLGLLEELVVFEKTRGRKKTTIENAKKFIESKTGVPQLVDKKSRQKLISLEEELHKRVVGQNDAINAISDAVRRSRTGINDSKKPIASFLFIGSTGVGKTETAKALAEAYFSKNGVSGEEKMIRFDMSEYSTSEAVAGLLGSTYTNKKGSLSKVINANPYSLILFDELEKANKEVHDLFLQILDEGEIRDVFGTKLNFRNAIIIATSNAGSKLIYQNALENLDIEEQRQKIIDYIIDNHIFRPEFLNRFDKVVMFQKLGYEEIKKISGFQLKSLQKRMRENSYDFVVGDSLTEYLATKGRTSVFGARETKRIIKSEIESAISKAILEEKILKGDSFVVIEKDGFLKVEKIES